MHRYRPWRSDARDKLVVQGVDERLECPVFLDALGEELLLNDTNVYILPLIGGKTGMSYRGKGEVEWHRPEVIQGIVLRRAGSSAGEFRRIGAFVCEQSRMEDDASDFQKSDMTAQLLQHKTGVITWQHIAAFVIDPLRDIQVCENGKVIFDRPLHTPQVFQIPAFRHLLVDLAETMGSGDYGSDKHSKFVSHLEALQSVYDLLQTFCDDDSIDANKVAYCAMSQHAEEMLYGIRCAVIRGDIAALLFYHNEYIRRLLLILPNPGICEPGNTNVDVGLSLQLLSNDQAVALVCALAVLDVAFPRDVDVFSLGAMHVERAITRWKMHNDLEDWSAELEVSGAADRRNDVGTGARDEIYYFNGLWCGGNHDRGLLWQMLELVIAASTFSAAQQRC